MKRFKFLGVLLVGLIGLVGFSSAGGSIYGDTNGVRGYGTLSQGVSLFPTVGYCYSFLDSNCISSSYLRYNGDALDDSWGAGVFCFSDSSGYDIRVRRDNCSYYYASFTEAGSFGGGGSSYTSEQCQQEYSLMPISSCDSEYCGLNGLCPEFSGSTISELYINGINHLGAPIININIPLEQAWDYEYTGDAMNINLSGENNVDYEYMDNIIRTQNSKPNDTDFNNIVSGLLPKFVPGLVIILFILFVFRFLKKIF